MAKRTIGTTPTPGVITVLQFLDRIPAEIKFAMKMAIVVGQQPTATQAERSAAVILMLVEAELFGAQGSMIDLWHERTQMAVAEIEMLGFWDSAFSAQLLNW